MSEWGERVYGEPCGDCGFSWLVDVDAARDLVRTLPGRAAELLADGHHRTRHPDLGWTVGGYASHVSDNLRIWSERLAAATAGGDATISAYDSDLLAEARRYNELPPEGVLWSLERSVEDWLAVTASAEAAEIVLQHPERGVLVVADVVRSNAHDVFHHEWDMRRTISEGLGQPTSQRRDQS